MRSLFLVLAGLALFSCTKQVERESKLPLGASADAAVSPSEGAASSPVSAEKIPAANEPDSVRGIRLQFATSEKSGAFYRVTELKILEEKSGKVIDSFPEFTWGTVTIKTAGEKLTWLRNSGKGSELNVVYSTDEKGDVLKTADCHMFQDPAAHDLYVKALPPAGDAKADWESVVTRLQFLAEHGNKEAFEFFMSPNSKQKAYSRYDDGAASFKTAREVLGFMKVSGCRWDQ